MFIKELSKLTNVTPKAIRYYESIGLMPPPQRGANNYRIYTPDAVERLRFIATARALDFGLSDIAQFLEARENKQLLREHTLTLVEQHILEVERRIADLLALHKTLNEIRGEAQCLPPDSECNEECICYRLTVEAVS